MSRASVDLLDEAVLASPYDAFERMRAAGSVHADAALGLFFVVDHDAIREVLDNPDVYSSHLVAVLQRGEAAVKLPDSVIPEGTDVLAIADPPAHSAHRKLVQPTFGKREVERLRAAIDLEVNERVEALVAQGGGDWMAIVASPVPVRVISGILGLPSEDAERLVRWSDLAVELLGGLADDDRLAVIYEALAEFMVYILDRLADTGAGLMVHVREAVEAGDLTRDEAMSMVLQLVAAGTESTTSLLGSAVRIIAGDGDVQARIRRDPDLIDDLIEETLRLESPFRGHFRVATRDATLAGTPIPAGGRLMLLWGAANRDPLQFDEPELLDLSRPGIKGHLGFGRGIHFCLGAHLARLEARQAIGSLVEQTADIRLASEHEDRYHPSLLIRRLDKVLISVTPSKPGA
jgi:cytochrome P450 family 144